MKTKEVSNETEKDFLYYYMKYSVLRLGNIWILFYNVLCVRNDILVFSI